MKIVTYNVNGLRQRVAQHGSLLRLLSCFDADIICFQETKLSRQDLSVDITMADGYEAFVSCNRTSRGRSGYSGVATFCRVTSAFSSTDVSLPLEAEEGFTGLLQSSKKGETTETFQLETPCQLEGFQISSEELLKVDSEGRCIVTDHGHFVVFNIYGPRAEDGDEERHRFKLVFFKILQKRLEFHLAQGKRVIVVGDLNIAPAAIDRCDADPDFEKNMFRTWLRSMFIEFGGPFFDVFRSKNPGRKEAYTCFSPNIGAEVFNYGSRIDHILIAGSCLHLDDEKKGHNFIACHVEECDILSHFKRGNSGNTPMWKGGRSIKLEGSDHVPVYVILRDIPDLSLHNTPSFAVRYFPEVRGWQQTIVSFLGKRKVASDLALNRSLETDRTATEAYDRSTVIQKDEGTMFENNLTDCVSQCSSIQSMHQKANPYLNKEHSSISISEETSMVVENEEPTSQSECTTKVKKRVSQLTLRSYFKQPKIVASDDKLSENSHVTPSEVDDVIMRNDLSNVLEQADIKQMDVKSSSEINESTKILPAFAEGSPCFVDKSERDSVALQEWQKIQQKMKSTLPLCKGHREPCVARSVKKGQNIGRLFYVCARPQGPASNPEANCNHFQWGYTKSKGKNK